MTKNDQFPINFDSLGDIAYNYNSTAWIAIYPFAIKVCMIYVKLRFLITPCEDFWTACNFTNDRCPSPYYNSAIEIIRLKS